MCAKGEEINAGLGNIIFFSDHMTFFQKAFSNLHGKNSKFVLTIFISC